jgi:toxin ParE1/3/4
VTIVWSPRALRNMRAAHAYVARENPAAARRMVERIIRVVELLLAASPRMGRPGRIAGTRELVVSRTPYTVVYRAGRESVDILAVLHHARDWPGAAD